MEQETTHAIPKFYSNPQGTGLRIKPQRVPEKTGDRKDHRSFFAPLDLGRTGYFRHAILAPQRQSTGTSQSTESTCPVPRRCARCSSSPSGPPDSSALCAPPTLPPEDAARQPRSMNAKPAAVPGFMSGGRR